MSDGYYGDVIYDVWRAGGNPDLVDADRCSWRQDEGLSAEDCAASELRAQRRRDDEPEFTEQDYPYEEPPREEPAMEETKQGAFEGWAVLEIFGHQRYAGYVTTDAFGQAVLFRVDVPPLPERERTTKCYEYVDGKGVPPGSTVKEAAVQGYTKYFGPGAIYAMTPCSQEVAEKSVAQTVTRSVSIVQLALPAAQLAGAVEADPYDDQDDDDDQDVR